MPTNRFPLSYIKTFVVFLKEHPEYIALVEELIAEVKRDQQARKKRASEPVDDSVNPEWGLIEINVPERDYSYYLEEWGLPKRTANQLVRNKVRPQEALTITRKEYLKLWSLGEESYVIFAALRKKWADAQLKRIRQSAV